TRRHKPIKNGKQPARLRGRLGGLDLTHESAMKLIRGFQRWYSIRRQRMFVTYFRDFLPILAALGTFEKMLFQSMSLVGFQNASRKQGESFFMMGARIHKRF